MEGNLGRLQRFVAQVWGEAKGPLYRNAIFLMLSSLIGSGLGFFFWVIVYRVYEVNDAGYAIALVNTVGFLAGIASLGLPIGLIRFLPESDNPTALVNTSLSITGVIAAALTIVFALGVTVWSPSLSFVVENPVYILVLVITAMAFAFAPVLDQAAIAMRRADLSTWRVTLFSILKIPLPLVFALWFTGRLGVYLSWSVAFGVSILVSGFLFLPRLIPGYWPKPRMSRRRVRPMFRFSVGNWVATVIGSAGSLLLPILILNVLGGGGAAGAAVYYAASVVAGMLYIIPNATMTSFFAEASQRGAQRQRDERKAVLLSVGLLVPGIVGMWILAHPLLGLFDLQQYEDLGAKPLQILTLASAPAFLNSLLSTRVRIRKEVLPIIVSAILTTGVTLGLGYVFLRERGLEGLAMAFVLGQAASTPYLLWVAGEAKEIEPIEPTPPPP